MTKSPAKAKTKTKTVAYDVAEQLRTPEEMAAQLDAWFVEAPDDAAGIARALGDIARAKGMSQVARYAGLSRESLYKALSENGNPSFATVLKVARAGSALARGSRLMVNARWPMPTGMVVEIAPARSTIKCHSRHTCASFMHNPSKGEFP